MVKTTVVRSSWGWFGLAESAKGVCAIVLPQTSKRAAEAKLRAVAGPCSAGPLSPGLRAARTALLRYLAGDRRAFSLKLDLQRGTPFQRRVWTVLRAMPYGSLRSYRWVAGRVGGAGYARAVGNAVGANPIPIVIPCHRVVASGSSLGGFSGGLSMKRRLLALEGTLASLAKPRPRKRGASRSRRPANRAS
ncbi:MAG TPA: methylated-DNA--[protein]-cysteine S-methyltransferase [Nitrospira sp.]|nr:methylated-DNA--[protein]-cysteine S-methyltransferase [Nitrospira sp.]